MQMRAIGHNYLSRAPALALALGLVLCQCSSSSGKGEEQESGGIAGQAPGGDAGNSAAGESDQGGAAGQASIDGGTTASAGAQPSGAAGQSTTGGTAGAQGTGRGGGSNPTSGGSSTGGEAAGGASSGGVTSVSGRLFPDDFYYNRDVSALPVADESAAILSTLGSWGNSDNFDITFDFYVFEATDATPTADVELEWEDESDILPLPVVPGGAVEGNSGYQCQDDGDCHYLVIQTDRNLLFETYASSEISPGQWQASDLAVWDLGRSYDPLKNRGITCTSGDAAGLPITPGLIRVHEVVTDGVIEHALRFILPNASMRANALVPPATHIGSPSSNDSNAPPYGIRLRLKASFDESSIASTGGKVVVRALKKYGMILADGGQIPLTAERDDFTAEKWDGVLSERDLRGIEVSDFDVVDFGPVRTYDSLPDCVIDNPLPGE